MSSAKKSAKYLFLSNIFSKIVTFIGSIVLARVLFPEDFGLLLLTGIVIGLVNTLGNMGFEYFYLQEKIDDSYYEYNILNMTFKLRFFFNVILFIVQYISSYWVQDYFNNIVVGEMLRIFSWNHLIMIPAQINIFILRKKLNFKPESIAIISGTIGDIVLKIIFALNGFGALSFAYGFIFGTFIKTLILIRFGSFYPDLNYWNNDIFKKIFFFGKYSFLGGIAIYFSNQLDKIIMSSSFSAHLLGGYQFSSGQVQNINSFVAKSFGNLIISYIAKYKHKPKQLLQTLSNITYIQFSIMSSIYIFLLFNINSIIYFVFGEKWMFSTGLFSIFLIRALITLFYAPLLNLLMGLGYPKVNAKLAWSQFFVSGIILLMIVLNSNDIVIFSSVFISLTIIFSIIKSFVGLKKISFSFKDYIKEANLLNLSIYLFILIFLNIYINLVIESTYYNILFSFLSICLIFYLWFFQYSKDIFFISLSTIIHKETKLFKYLLSLTKVFK